jgi:D-alanine-D-alanine ligase
VWQDQKERSSHFPVTEIISKTDFFDYEAKYTYEGLADEVVPADIPDDVAEECRKISTGIFMRN